MADANGGDANAAAAEPQPDLEVQQSEPINDGAGNDKPALAEVADSDNPQSDPNDPNNKIQAAAGLAPTDPNEVQMSSENVASGENDGDLESGKTDNKTSSEKGSGSSNGANTKVTKTVTPPDHGMDLHQLSTSMFEREGQATLLWVSFTTFYWTFVVWIPALIERSFFQPGFFGWCFGFVAMICCFYTYKQGAWPSGGTRDDPTSTKGIGRYTAFGLTLCVCCDFLVLSFYSISDGVTVDQVFRGSCHFISLVWASLFFFNKFHHVNPDIAITAFFGEWLDVAFTIIVLFILHNALFTDDDNDDGCFSIAICVVYYIAFIFQLMGWLFPMMLIPGWGTGTDGRKVSAHLFFLDIVTDIPIIMAVLIEDAYATHVIIFIDVLWKVTLTIRSLGYYLIYEIWLQKGDRVFKRNFLSRSRGDTLK